jgi:hypothetical protein
MIFLLLLFGILPVYSTLRFGKAIVHYKEHISGSQPPWAKTGLFSARNGECVNGWDSEKRCFSNLHRTTARLRRGQKVKRNQQTKQEESP